MTTGPSIAVVGLACRFPDADDTAALLDLVATRRRAFRRIPSCRVDLAAYFQADPGAPDATYSSRAALIEGWQFDRSAFGIDEATYASTDVAVWLALETAARLLAATGHAGGTGLPGDRAGAFIGNTLAGDVSRATALRLRWPHAQQVMAEAMSAADVPDDLALRALRAAAGRFRHPLPPVTEQTLAGSMPAAIAATIGRQLGLRGTSMAVDTASASALSAVASACLALACGEVDVAIAGGVEVGMDPLNLVGMAKAGQLAAGRMRIYDQHPSGFLPGEGCGMVLLMRAPDARAARLPVYAEIAGWGVATPGRADSQSSLAEGHLRAMRSAYARAGVDPADVQYVEGCGAGIAAADEAELVALATLRSGAAKAAALGSISANIGNTRAASGAAGLIKTVIAMTNGMLPPTTGIRTPHPMLSSGHAALRCPVAPEPWPAGARHAGISSVGCGDLVVHLVLRQQPERPSPPAGKAPALRAHAATRAKSAQAADAVLRLVAARSRGSYCAGPGHPFAYLLDAPDQPAMLALLSRISAIAPSLSDAQMQDLAIQVADEASGSGSRCGGLRLRVAIVAARQEELAELSRQARDLLPELTGPALVSRPGIVLSGASRPRGQIAILLAGQPGPAHLPQHELSRILAITGWLDKLGVRIASATGHGIGELAGLVWAGCISTVDARALAALRSAALATADAAPGLLSTAIDAYTAQEFASPRRRLISAGTGKEVAAGDEIAELLSAELFDARLAASGRGRAPTGQLTNAVRLAAADADLLLRTSLDRDLTAAADAAGAVASVSIEGDPADDRQVARAAAALFAVGALGTPGAVYSGRPSRPINIWRDQTFITNPCQVRPPLDGDGRAERDGQASGQRAGSPPGTRQPATGVAPWSRCYVEELRVPEHPVPSADDRPWLVHIGGCEPLRKKVGELFRQHQDSDRTLAVLGGLDDGGTCEAALRAAQDAIRTGQLVAISSGPALAGIWASLHAEHPRIGVTVIRAPSTPAGLSAAARVAAAAPGQHRELVIGADGAVSEPAMVPVRHLGGASFPLGPGDVALISRGSGAAGLALAEVLACSGAAVAIIGRDHPRDDGEVIGRLEQLRGAGARIGYEVVDMSDHDAMVAAVRRVESRFGRVTAVSHASGPAPGLAIAELTRADVHDHLRIQIAPLDRLVAAVRGADRAVIGRSARLRLIATFGSVVSRYGLAQEGMLALVSGALADYGERLAGASPGCQAIHVDWPPWSGAGLGERADLVSTMERGGAASMPSPDGSRLLLKLLATDGLPARVAVHGRLGAQAPRPVAIAGRPGERGRFVEQILAHYPGVELVAQARLSLRCDPYLDDYRVDGVCVLPPVMALEAMAQVASALAGAPVRHACEVSVAAPAVLPAGAPSAATVIRICALRDGDAITVVLRSDNSGFAVDHCRARFAGPEAPDEASADVLALPELPGPTAPSVDGSELYGSACFQSGRFRRLATVYLTSARSAIGLAYGSDVQPWFGSARPELLLGSAGVSDATLQLTQACLPGRRLVLAGCDSVTFSGRRPAGVVTVRVTPVEQAVPRQVDLSHRGDARRDHELVWDAEAIDATGHPLVRWRGLRMRDAGPAPAGIPVAVPKHDPANANLITSP